MLLHAAQDRHLKKRGVDVNICREVIVLEMVIVWVIAMVMTEVMMMMVVMTKRLDDLQRSVDSICGASQKGVVR